MSGINPPSPGRLQIDPNASALDSTINPYNISIPEQFGQIEEVFQGDATSPLIVHIQNVHANYEAQVNIKNILGHLVNQYQFSLIQLEGAVSKLDPTILQPSYLKEANLKLVDFLMRDGRITGADAFAVETDKPVELYGIEDYSLYMENLKMFKTIYKHQEDLKPYFDEVHRLILSVGPKLLSPEQLDFTRKTEEFSTDKIDLLDYLVYMNKLSEKHKLASLNEMTEMVNYPNLTRLTRLKNLEEELNKAGLKKETEAIKLEFKKKMPDSTKVDELLSRLDESAKGTNPRAYFLELTKLADEAKIDFIAYPAFRIFAEFLIHQDEIDHRGLFSELKQFEHMLQEKLFTSEAEKLFLSIIDRIGLLEQFFRLEMSREKIVLYLKDKETVKPSWVYARLDELAKKNNVVSKPVGDLEKLDSYIDDVEYYYQLVLERDEVFVDKILTKTKSMSLDKTIIVTGGFHKDGLIDYFRKEKISYVIINPKVDVKEGNQNYLKVMLDEEAVAGSVFAGTFALELANYSNPGSQFDTSVQVFAPGVLVTQFMVGADFDVAKANDRLKEVTAVSGVSFGVKFAQPGFTNTLLATAQFYNVDGTPRGVELSGKVDKTGNFSVRIIDEFQPSKTELEKNGVTSPPSFPPSIVGSFPDLEEIFSFPKPPAKVITPSDFLALPFPFHDLFVPLGFNRSNLSVAASDYLPELVGSSRAELRRIEKLARNGIPTIEELRAIKTASRGVSALAAIADANLPGDISDPLNYLSTPRAKTNEPIFLAFALSDVPDVARAQVEGLNQAIKTNPQNTAVVIYGKEGALKLIGFITEMLGQQMEDLQSVVVVEKTGGRAFQSADEATARMYKDIQNGSMIERFTKFKTAKEQGMKRLGVIINADQKGLAFSRTLTNRWPDAIQLVNLDPKGPTLAGNTNTIAALNSLAVQVLAKITGLSRGELLRQIEEAGLGNMMRSIDGNGVEFLAAAMKAIIQIYENQRQLLIAA